MNTRIEDALDLTRNTLNEYKNNGKQVACSVSGGGRQRHTN